MRVAEVTRLLTYAGLIPALKVDAERRNRMTIAAGMGAMWLPLTGLCRLIDVVSMEDSTVENQASPGDFGKLAPRRHYIRPQQRAVRSRQGLNCLTTFP